MAQIFAVTRSVMINCRFVAKSEAYVLGTYLLVILYGATFRNFHKCRCGTIPATN